MAGIHLYDYQLDAVRRMKNGCILRGGVGSGKSLTALSYYYLRQGGEEESLLGGTYFPMGDPPKDLYIITTAKKRDTLEWEGELSPFLLSTNPDVNLYPNKVVIDSWNNISKYKDITDAFFIFDEQRVVGSGTWVKSFLKIAKRNEWILLSATPGDTWEDYIPVFVANGFYRNRTEFKEKHIIYTWVNGKYPKVDRYLNVGRLIRLRESILVDMDFKRKTISHHEDIYVKYNTEAYKDVGRLRWDPFKNEPINNASGLCYVWRRIVNSDLSRQVALLELFEDHPKMIVFYNFDYELDILKTMFGRTEGVEVAEWNGHKHQPVPTGDSWVYLVQYNAGCEGWNCIQTDTIAFYSENYSYKVMQQAAGRIDRLNTPFTDLHYYHLKSRSGIDLGIARALIMQPELIIADEAISALDVSIQAQVVNLLKSIQLETGCAILFIAHDLSMVRYISDTIGVLHLGHMVESGTTSDVFEHAVHPYTRSLLSAIPRPNPRLEHDRPIESYVYETSGIDYNKGKEQWLTPTHMLLATDEEKDRWTARASR